MSTKYFHWDGDAASAFTGMQYPGGNPVEHVILEGPTLAVQGWNGITSGQRIALIARLQALGWIEGHQSKPD